MTREDIEVGLPVATIEVAEEKTETAADEETTEIIVMALETEVCTRQRN